MTASASRADWVLATHNQGKLAELQALLARVPIALRGATDFALPEPDETGESFEDNASLKARAAASATGLVALADDSGVAVHALDGAPGIYTARWAGPERDFSVACQRVQDRLDELGPEVDRRATYVCVLCVAEPDGRVEFHRGETHGVLVWPLRGTLGFGFEPMFLPDGYALTYGEMTPAQRLEVNARAQAIRKLIAARFPNGGT